MKNFKILFLSIIIGLFACAISIFAFSSPGSNQPPNGNPTFWLLNGTNMYYSGGNVGIGISTPGVALDINGTIRATNTNFGMSYGRFEGAGGAGTTGTRIIPLTTTVINTGGLTLSSNSITVSKAGIYRVSGFFDYDTKDSSAGDVYLYLYKNGVQEAYLSHFRTVLGTGGYAVEAVGISGDTIVSLNANDSLSLYVSGDIQVAGSYSQRMIITQLPN